MPQATAPRKRLTISDIARMANTSKTTVSFFLNGHTDRMSDETRRRIQAVVNETGYEPSPLARGMNAKRTRLIGVIITDITNTFSNQIVKGIESVANEHGYRILVSSSNRNREEERAYIDSLLSVGVDGFIVQPTAQFKEVSKSIEEAGRRLVFFDSKFYDFTSSWVKSDNYEATYQAIDACVQRGYRRFLLVAAPPALLSPRIERSSGFVDALETRGLSYEQFEIEGSAPDGERLRAFLGQHVDGEAPTLVFAPNCWALPDIYRTMQGYRPLMPGKVGLLGFDNTEWTPLAGPSVSVIVQPALEEGRQACRILLDLISGSGRVNPHQVLGCEVIWGDSTL